MMSGMQEQASHLSQPPQPVVSQLQPSLGGLLRGVPPSGLAHAEGAGGGGEAGVAGGGAGAAARLQLFEEALRSTPSDGLGLPRPQPPTPTMATSSATAASTWEPEGEPPPPPRVPRFRTWRAPSPLGSAAPASPVEPPFPSADSGGGRGSGRSGSSRGGGGGLLSGGGGTSGRGASGLGRTPLSFSTSLHSEEGASEEDGVVEVPEVGPLLRRELRQLAAFLNGAPNSPVVPAELPDLSALAPARLERLVAFLSDTAPPRRTGSPLRPPIEEAAGGAPVEVETPRAARPWRIDELAFWRLAGRTSAPARPGSSEAVARRLDGLECSICCQPVEHARPDSIALACSENGCPSMFHSFCIRPWLERNPNCPLCRFDVAELVRARSPPPLPGARCPVAASFWPVVLTEDAVGGFDAPSRAVVSASLRAAASLPLSLVASTTPLPSSTPPAATMGGTGGGGLFRLQTSGPGYAAVVAAAAARSSSRTGVQPEPGRRFTVVRAGSPLAGAGRTAALGGLGAGSGAGVGRRSVPALMPAG